VEAETVKIQQHESSPYLEEAAEATLARIREDRGKAPRQLQGVFTYLESHLFDSDLKAGVVLTECGVGRDHGISSLFTHKIRTSLWQYISDRRLEVAERLLVSSPLKPWRIGTAVGYSSLGSFSRAFQRKYGLRPLPYRKARTGSVSAPGRWPTPEVEP
jgi:AraC-like DNA-binding protein